MSTETLAERLSALLNGLSREQDSDTPDFILAEFLVGALEAFELGVNRREGWYGRPHEATDITPAEAVTAFAAWLTTRDEAVTLGAAHDSAGPCALLKRFCDHHGLGGCREGWKGLEMPSESQGSAS